MSTAVFYYSLGGNSALAAKALAEKLGATLVQIKERKQRTKINFASMGFQAALGLRSRLATDPAAQTAPYDTLHVLTPIWASNMTPAVRAFLSGAALKGKRVTLYAVMADPGLKVDKISAAARKIVEAAGGTLVAVHGLHGGAPGKDARAQLAQDITGLQ